MKFTLNWNITTYEATAMGGHQGKKKNHARLVPEPCIFIRLFLGKKIKFYMRGAESSKRFMSYEIYFELEYYYLRSNYNGWV